TLVVTIMDGCASPRDGPVAEPPLVTTCADLPGTGITGAARSRDARPDRARGPHLESRGVPLIPVWSPSDGADGLAPAPPARRGGGEPTTVKGQARWVHSTDGTIQEMPLALAKTVNTVVPVRAAPAELLTPPATTLI